MTDTLDTNSGQPSAAAGEVLVRVENLTKHFPIRKGLFARTVGQVRAVDGVSFDIWQEYALYFTLPMSFLGFLLGNLLGEESRPTPEKEASA